MAELRWSRASVRSRTTAAAVLVVAVVLLAGALTLVALVRGSLRDGLEATADQRVEALVQEVETTGLPATGPADDEGDDGEGREGRDTGDEPGDDPEDPDDPEELVWQVTDADGGVVASSQSLSRPLPTDDAEETRLPGADHRYLVVTEDAEAGDRDYVVAVAVSLEEVEDSTAALIPPLLVGLPLVLLLVGGTTWVVATRALTPVERIRREVERISGDQLDRRVPEPRSRDEIHRLARTMNQMLARLQHASHRQRQFVSDASHELRSPLASIRQTAEVARAHPDALPQEELVDAVLEESARMQRLVDQLLLLTRLDEGAPVGPRREVDLDDLVLSEAARARRSGPVVETAHVGPARVRGDGPALGQVVRNLVDNAVRHARTRIALSLREAEQQVVLVVEDDGPGIAEHDRDRVFERFVRLDEARDRDAGGSGLGLAIVREIVEAHRGTVAVSASPLGGARFDVRLPGAGWDVAS